MGEQEKVILMFILGIAAFFVFIKYNDIKNKKSFILKQKAKWKKIPNREYTYEELESISSYFRHRSDEGFCIDDITWNDLDMNSIFMLMNNTNSSVGEQYLYYLLRTPQFDKEILEKRRTAIDYLESHEEERIKLQCIYGEIGRTRKISISDYIYNLTDLKSESNFLHYVSALLGILSIATLITIPTIGILIFIITLTYNISSYYKKKMEIEPYFISLTYILKMIKGADRLCKEIPKELRSYVEKMDIAKKSFNRVRKNEAWIKTSNEGPMDLLMDYVKMFFHIDLIKFNNMLSEVQKNLRQVDILLDCMGSIEAYISVASYRGVRDYYCIPRLIKSNDKIIDIEEIYHPLIFEPVTNNINEKKSTLITGSNASGKSTFLKTVAINAVLAQTIYMVNARKYTASFFKIYSSMALNDNLSNNESYYIVEIKSLKRILDSVSENIPILCFIDEVLRGTNTVERIAASAQILNSLARSNVLCYAATHDIELTQILEDIYSNYHFEEKVENNDILFDYKLKKGRAETRNAIKLLSIIGYNKNIIDSAEKRAEQFIATNSWGKL